MNTDTLLAHVASQTRANLELLIAQHQLSLSDCQPLLDKLSSIENLSRITAQAQNVVISPPRISSPPQNSPVTDTYRRSSLRFSSPRPSPAPQFLYRARALWGYNEHNQESKDLVFMAGDIIEVLKETNADWWEGRCNGRVGLFPSNYVEKISSPDFQAPPVNSSPAATGNKLPSHTLTPNYQPPPYPQSGPAPYSSVGYPSPPVSLIDQRTFNPKKPIYDGPSGNSTLAYSPVHGIGFGSSF